MSALPSSSRPVLIDPRGPRLAAALSSLVLAGALLAGSPGSAWLLAGQAVAFALGTAGRSPYLGFYRRALRPYLPPPHDLEDARPVRFAQAVGLLFTLVALAGAAAGLPAIMLGAASAALGAAFLNAAFGVCLGCELYLFVRRIRAGRRLPTTRFRTEVSHE